MGEQDIHKNRKQVTCQTIWYPFPEETPCSEDWYLCFMSDHKEPAMKWWSDWTGERAWRRSNVTLFSKVDRPGGER